MGITTLNTTILNGGGGIIIKRGEGGGSTPTPPSGGGESASTIEYFVYDKGTASAVATYAQYVKIEAMEGMIKAVMPYSPTTSEIIEQMGGEIKAFGANLNERVLFVQGDVFRDSTILEGLAESGITREKIDSIPRLTKEQFYDLNA